MQRAQYPERQCKETVWSLEGNPYPCELVDLHPGPHASYSQPNSVTTRDAWETNNPDWREGIGSNDIIV